MKSLQRSTDYSGRQNGDVPAQFFGVTEVFSNDMISIYICDHFNWYEKADNYIGVGIMQISALFLRNCFRVFLFYIEYSMKMGSVN